jgi:hypothetical protein
MVEIQESLTPEQADTMLMEWNRLTTELSRIKSQEMLLRMRLFQHFFPDAVEGTNKHQLGAGYSLTAAVPYTREVDEEALQSKDNELKAAGIDSKLLIKWKPSLVTSAYRELTDVQMRVFDSCLTIKPGAPTLKIVEPKK